MASFSDESINTLMQINYNKKVVAINQLDGYVDHNFRLEIQDWNSDKTFGYDTVILKISSDSVNINLQHRLMIYLYDKGVKTCRPLNTVEGTTSCRVRLNADPAKDSSADCVACVLTYVPGVTLQCAGHPVDLIDDIGRFAGMVDTFLLHFERDNLNCVDTIWELSRAPELESLIDEYCKKDVKELVMDIINASKKDIEPVLDSFQKGYIHGDLNDCNFIVSRTTSDAEKYVISGVIDYGDACVGFYVYEIATLMADIMSVCRNENPLEIGKLILRGYRQEFNLNPAELERLRLIICVRMVQFYVLGAEIVSKDPGNTYAGLDRDAYIKMCKHLWEIGDEPFIREVLEKTDFNKP